MDQQKVQRDSEKRRGSLQVSIIGKDYMKEVKHELGTKIHTVRKDLS